jgi:HEPN domain-containing protein
MLDEDEYSRWMKTSIKTLESAKGDINRGDYNWACFKAHQAAEFAVKALLYGLGLSAYGHSVSGLLMKMPNELEVQKVLQEAKTLDKYYIPTRYPNAWSEGAPEDYYTRGDGEKAIDYAEKIINWVEGSWKLLKKEES